MEVTCDFFGPMREAVGQKTVVYEVESDTTVGELLWTIADNAPGLEDHLFDADGELDAAINVTRNGRNVRLEDGRRTPLENGDLLRVATSIVGG